MPSRDHRLVPENGHVPELFRDIVFQDLLVYLNLVNGEVWVFDVKEQKDSVFPPDCSDSSVIIERMA